MRRLRVVLDARERDGARGYHLCAALMLVKRDLSALDLSLAESLDQEEAQAFEAFCFDKGVGYSTITLASEEAPDLLLLAIDGVPALSRHAGVIDSARHRTVASLSWAVDDAEAVTVAGLNAHDTRNLARLIEVALDAAARERGLVIA